MRPAGPSKTESLTFAVIAGMGVVILMTGLIFSFRYFATTTRHNHEDGEIAALGAALESYKADLGDYPSNAASDRLSPNTDFSPSVYIPSSTILYEALSGVSGGRVYFEFSPAMLATNSVGAVYLVDSFGNSYGYAYPGPKNGTGFYDLWSTKGGTTAAQTNEWVGNW